MHHSFLIEICQSGHRWERWPPNPTKNKIFLKSDKKELSQIKIFDLLGKDLTQKALISVLGTDKVSIDLSNFIQGIYIIKTKTIANKVYKK